MELLPTSSLCHHFRKLNLTTGANHKIKETFDPCDSVQDFFILIIVFFAHECCSVWLWCRNAPLGVINYRCGLFYSLVPHVHAQLSPPCPLLVFCCFLRFENRFEGQLHRSKLMPFLIFQEVQSNNLKYFVVCYWNGAGFRFYFSNDLIEIQLVSWTLNHRIIYRFKCTVVNNNDIQTI